MPHFPGHSSYSFLVEYMNNCSFYQVTEMLSKGDFEFFILVECMNRLFFLSRTQSSPSSNNVSCAFTPDVGNLN